MTRKEIYDKIFQMLNIEQNHLRRRYEFGDISKEEFEEMSEEVQETYENCIKEMALCGDEEVVEKMSNILALILKVKQGNR